MDENARIIRTLYPFSKDKSQRAVRQPIYNRNSRRVNAVIKTNKLVGQPKFHSTKVLVAYLASILSYDIAKGNVDSLIFTTSLISLLSLDHEVLKKKIGNDNYSYYTDHISSALLNHFSFGNQIRDLT